MRATLMGLLILSLFFGTRSALATTFVYVHGWTLSARDFTDCTYQSSCLRDDGSSRYFDEELEVDGVNDRRVHFGWNTAVDWRQGNSERMASFFDDVCRDGSCTVICHSTGCAMTARTLDYYGEGGSRWRVNRVLALASSEGGSELGSFHGGSGAFITPSVVRGAYDHNDTAGVPFFLVAGYDGGAQSALLPGQDDGTVAFHSACGYVKVFSSSQCSNDWEWANKCYWWGCVPVQRTVGQWANHKRVEYCGRDGCDKNHDQLKAREFQELARVANP